MYGKGRDADGHKCMNTCSSRLLRSSQKGVSPLGPQSLPSEFDLEPKLWRRAGHRDRLRLRGLGEAVVLPLVLLVFLVLPLVNAVQT